MVSGPGREELLLCVEERVVIGDDDDGMVRLGFVGDFCWCWHCSVVVRYNLVSCRL